MTKIELGVDIKLLYMGVHEKKGYLSKSTLKNLTNNWSDIEFMECRKSCWARFNGWTQDVLSLNVQNSISARCNWPYLPKSQKSQNACFAYEIEKTVEISTVWVPSYKLVLWLLSKTGVSRRRAELRRIGSLISFKSTSVI